MYFALTFLGNWPTLFEFFKIGRTFLMYWLENNFETWQHCFADKCTVQYSRSLFYRQRRLCLALFSILTLRSGRSTHRDPRTATFLCVSSVQSCPSPFYTATADTVKAPFWVGGGSHAGCLLHPTLSLQAAFRSVSGSGQSFQGFASCNPILKLLTFQKS